MHSKGRWGCALALILLIVTCLAWVPLRDAYRARNHIITVRDPMTANSIGRGTEKRMHPVNLKLYRGGGETNYEHLEFNVPAAYLSYTDDLIGGNQQEIILNAHWPSGGPDSVAPDEYAGPVARRQFWPSNKYTILLGINMSRGFVSTLRTPEEAIGLNFAGRPLQMLPERYCGWYAYDVIDPDRNDAQTFEVLERYNEYPLTGLTAEYYLDTPDLSDVRTIIDCGSPGTCSIRTEYRTYPLEVSLSPRHVCESREILAQATALLDRLLVDHHPPTRLSSQWDGKNSDERWGLRRLREYQERNLNNPDMRNNRQ